MSCFETVLDRDFVYAVQQLAAATEDIADKLTKTEEQNKLKDEQVKEIISSYSAEDLYDLLNYDQKMILSAKLMEMISPNRLYSLMDYAKREHVYDLVRKKKTEDDVIVMLHDEFSNYCEGNTDEDLRISIAEPVALRYLSGDYDCNDAYLTNLRSLILQVKEGK